MSTAQATALSRRAWLLSDQPASRWQARLGRAYATWRRFVANKPGMLGLEQSLASVMETMVHTGRMGWPDVVRVMSTMPARIGRASGQGRPLRPGEPANLVLVDPARRAVVDRAQSRSMSRNNPYHGMELPDPIEATMWRGRWTYRRG